jgi:murein DD-endopeptidase MepM/ murein hydrolase activator NlpD
MVQVALPGAAGAEELMLPVAPACISSPFGPRILSGRPKAGTFHYGIDLPAPEGAAVRAVAPGQVIRVQRHGPGGLEMLIQHDGFVAVYSHLGKVAPVIAEGRRAVFGGEKIGTVGRTGVTYGMHLYFGIFVNGRPTDPAPYLQVPPCSSGRPAEGIRGADGKLLPSRTYPGSSHRVAGIILPATSGHPAQVRLSRAPQ